MGGGWEGRRDRTKEEKKGPGKKRGLRGLRTEERWKRIREVGVRGWGKQECGRRGWREDKEGWGWKGKEIHRIKVKKRHGLIRLVCVQGAKSTSLSTHFTYSMNYMINTRLIISKELLNSNNDKLNEDIYKSKS